MSISSGEIAAAVVIPVAVIAFCGLIGALEYMRRQKLRQFSVSSNSGTNPLYNDPDVVTTKAGF